MEDKPAAQVPPLSRSTRPQQVAITAMLVTAAIRDGEFASSEKDRILQLVCGEFALATGDAGEMLEQAVAQVVRTTSLSVLLGELQYELTLAQKQQALLMLLKVIAADGRQTAEEIELISRASDSLRLSSQATHEVYSRYFAEHRGQ